MYCWSISEEGPFQGDCASVDEALCEAEEGLKEENAGETCVVFIGKIKPAIQILTPSYIGEGIVEIVDNILCENTHNDGASLVELSKDHLDTLGEIVISYLKEHAEFPMNVVTNVEEHKINLTAGKDRH